MSDIEKLIDQETEASEENHDAPIPDGATLAAPTGRARRCTRSGSTATR